MANKWPEACRFIDVLPIRKQEFCGKFLNVAVRGGSGFTAFHLPFDYGDSELADQLICSGEVVSVGQWLPIADPSSGDNFYGVNRSVDLIALSGCRYFGSGMPLFEGILAATTHVVQFGGRPDTLVMNERNYKNYMLETRGFARGNLHPGGEFKYLCVEKTAGEYVFILQSNTWAWHDVPTDERWYGQLVCSAPGFNARLTP